MVKTKSIDCRKHRVKQQENQYRRYENPAKNRCKLVTFHNFVTLLYENVNNLTYCNTFSSFHVLNLSKDKGQIVKFLLFL